MLVCLPNRKHIECDVGNVLALLMVYLAIKPSWLLLTRDSVTSFVCKKRTQKQRYLMAKYNIYLQYPSHISAMDIAFVCRRADHVIRVKPNP